MSTASILIVEDEVIIAADLEQKLRHLGYRVAASTDRGEDAIALARQLRPDLVLMDICLPGSTDGITAAEIIRRECDLPVVFLTAHSDAATVERAKLAEPFSYIVKPFDDREISTLIEVSLYKHQADRRVREQREWLRVTLTSIGDAVITCDTESRITFINPVAETVTGWTAAEAMEQPIQSVFRLVDEQTRQPCEDPVARVQREGRAFELTNHTAIMARNGRLVPIEDSAAPILDASGRVIGVVLVFHDVTQQRAIQDERRRIAQKLQEAARLDSLVTLTGGIAHDFNNILTGILGQACLGQRDLDPASPLMTNFERIKQASLRAAELCKQMLAYSGQSCIKVRPVDLGQLVKDSVGQIQPSIATKAALELRLDAHLPPVQADAAQLQQVILNLVTNASEAIGDSPGTILLTTGRVTADRQLLASLVEPCNLPEGECVFLEVADDGCGISRENLRRIFEPFFTTKFAGRGLGLAAVQGIVLAVRGGLRVVSEPGRGTTIRVYLPAGIAPTRAASAPPPESRLPRLEGIILLVDDDEGVRVAVTPVLQRAGYTVTTAANGEEALTRLAERAGEYQLVILDLIMPGLSGAHTLAELRKIRPDVKVLLTSGLGETETTERFGVKGQAGFLEKPFLPDDLLHAVQRIFV